MDVADAAEMLTQAQEAVGIVPGHEGESLDLISGQGRVLRRAARPERAQSQVDPSMRPAPAQK